MPRRGVVRGMARILPGGMLLLGGALSQAESHRQNAERAAKKSPADGVHDLTPGGSGATDVAGEGIKLMVLHLRPESFHTLLEALSAVLIRRALGRHEREVRPG